MNLKDLITAHWRTGLIGGTLATVTGLLCLTTKMGDGVVGLSYDWLFLFRRHIPVEGVTILYMDPPSEAVLGQQPLASWDRAIHARLIERLGEFKPRAIVFDVLFQESTNDPAADEWFARAAGAASNVVVAGKSTPQLYEGEIFTWGLTPPFQALRAAAGWGVVEISDSDKVFRSHHYREDQNMPSMAWRVAELTEAHPPARYQPRGINYYGPPGMLPHLSYYQVFEAGTNAIPAGALSAAISNKVVFVGALSDIGFTGGKRSDDYRTPYTAWTGRRSAGVEIQATAYLNLVRGDWLRRPSPWAEAAIILLGGVGFGMGLALLRPVPAVVSGVVGFLLIGAVAVLLAWQRLIWFPWLVLGAIQIPCALGWAVLAHTRRLYREKKALEQTLAMASGGGGSPAWAGHPPGLPFEGMRTRLASPSPYLTPTPGGGVSLASLDEHPLPIVPDHELLRCIGKGAYGEVYLARDVIGTFHAVKVVHRQGRHDPAALEREFNGLKNFTPISRSHPGFVHILQVGRNDSAGYLYYVMELGDDESTGQKIDPDTYSAKTLSRELKKRGRLPLSECLHLCIPLANALDYLHQQNLIHRDIKPANIIFVGGKPKFADIGLVTAVAIQGRDVTMVGTPGRMAPEGPGKPTADLYSLGKVLYEAGFGMDLARFPELPTDVIESADESSLFGFNRIIMKACDYDLSLRYQSVAELLGDLVALQKRMGQV